MMNSNKSGLPDECVVGVFDSAAKAETAVKDLNEVGFGSDRVSVIRRHFDPDPKAAEEMSLGDDSLRDAAIGGAMGGVVGAAGAATLMATGVGIVLMSGPLVALTGAIVGAFLGAMRGWGVREHHLKQYEKDVEEGKTLVVVSGDPTTVARAEQLLRLMPAEKVYLHARTGDDSREVDDRPVKQ
jgi:hypothetical protein